MTTLPLALPRRDRSTLRSAIRWVPLAVGLALCGMLVRELQSDDLRQALLALAPHLSLLLMLEAARFIAELTSTRLLLETHTRVYVPFFVLLRSQCLSHACNKALPAGRAAGEALKATLLSPHVGVGRAAGAGAATQVMTLLVNGAIALVAALCASTLIEDTPYTWIMAAYGIVTIALGFVLIAAMRSRRAMALMMRVSFLRSRRSELKTLVESGTRMSGWALFFFASAKLAQTLQLAILLAAVGAVTTPALATLAEGIQIVGAAAGDLVPAQLGATESAFTLAAPLLGIAKAEGLSIAVVLHGSQLLFAALCVVVATGLRWAPKADRAPALATTSETK